MRTLAVDKDSGCQGRTHRLGELHLANSDPAPAPDLALAIKRGIDLAVATALVPALLPLFLLLSVAIRLSSRGPVVFRQERVGLHGRRFTLLKLRTMQVGAEARRLRLEHRNEMSGPVFKIRDDPRTTAMGRLLRRYSLDELPQLWNVLKGDMSLVGPRPAIPDEVGRYEPWQKRRLSMRPGMTCLWQVRGRNEVDFDLWMGLDLEYIDNWSLWLDFKILLQTIPAVLFGRGAY